MNLRNVIQNEKQWINRRRRSSTTLGPNQRKRNVDNPRKKANCNVEVTYSDCGTRGGAELHGFPGRTLRIPLPTRVLRHFSGRRTACRHVSRLRLRRISRILTCFFNAWTAAAVVALFPFFFSARPQLFRPDSTFSLITREGMGGLNGTRGGTGTTQGGYTSSRDTVLWELINLTEIPILGFFLSN